MKKADQNRRAEFEALANAEADAYARRMGTAPRRRSISEDAKAGFAHRLKSQDSIADIPSTHGEGNLTKAEIFKAERNARDAQSELLRVENEKFMKRMEERRLKKASAMSASIGE